MNRHAVLKSLTAVCFMAPPAFVPAPNHWTIIGRQKLPPNPQSAGFALRREIVGLRLIAMEVKNNSVWLYDLKLASFKAMANTQPLVLNDSATRTGCLPHVSVRYATEQPEAVDLDIECLPCTDRPIEILLWGTA